MKIKIVLKDEVNCRIENLPLPDRKFLSKKYALRLPYAYHTEKFKLGRWDGNVNFFSLGGGTYSNILPEILKYLSEKNYEFELEDHRVKHDFSKIEPVNENSLSHIKWPVGHPHEGQPVTLRDYQVNAINMFINNTQALQELSTSSGKTIITATLSKLVEPYGKSIVIVPNKSLVEQTLEDYENIGLDVGVYYGDRKDLDKTHTICTWQSLEAMERQMRAEKRKDGLKEFSKGIIAVIVDEAHGASADILKRILTGPFANVPLRWGLTGTIPKDDVSRMSLKINLGEVVNKVKASELQDKGVLSSCNINVLQTQDNIVYQNYQSEISYLTTNTKRIEWMASQIIEICKSGNTLILVDKLKTGNELKKLIPDSVFLSGKDKQKDRKAEYKSINHSENKPLIATFGIASTGISITKLHNVVLIEPGKSFVRTIQSIGRGLRKGFDKDHVEIWDICSDSKYSKKHLTERKKYYREAGYSFKVNKITY
jgi:superfamily II DNA or RNA helicase